MYIEKLDGTKQPVNGKTADKLRNAWSEQTTNKLTADQQAYIDTVKQIVYGPDQHFCFCRFALTKTVPMRTSNLYILTCPQCQQTRTTDLRPIV